MVDLDFAVRTDDPPLGAFLQRVLAPFAADGEPAHLLSLTTDGGTVEVRFDGEVILSPERRHLVPILLWHLNQMVMLDTSSGLMLHAGVVSKGDQGVLIPGVANAGKSTLVAALVVAGFEYFSDEGALLDLEQQRILPYRRWLALEAGSWPLVPSLRPSPHPGYDHADQWLIAAQDLPGAHDRPACTPRVIVFPSLHPGEGTSLEPLSRATAVRDLSLGATNLADLGERGFQALVGLARTATSWRLRLDGVDESVAVLESLVTQGA
jgi:hypothetical protein